MPATKAPHDFAKFRDAEIGTTLIFGAGLSAGHVPFPVTLLNEIKTDAEAELQCGPIACSLTDPACLYKWAEGAFDHISRGGDQNPKLTLAKAMRLLTNPRWTVDVDLNGALPRHRAVARLAREELWTGVWSLNWDCMFESALESIGFVRRDASRSQPWLTSYLAIVTEKEFSKISSTFVLKVLKPHGCVHALLEAAHQLNAGDATRAQELAERLMITESELRTTRTGPLDQKFFNTMITAMQSGALVVAGWSVSEPYLQSFIRTKLKALRSAGTLEDLSIIDIEYNAQGHAELTQAYKLTKEDVFFEVRKIGDRPDIDQFFQWLQARYCLSRLIEVCVTAGETTTAARIKSAASSIAIENLSNFDADWADMFLPAWTRLCWRGGMIDCPGFQPHQLNMDKKHEHIPWRLPVGAHRPDLLCAAKLFDALERKKLDWDVGLYPGALWFAQDRRLVIPLPAWGSLNHLAGLKPMINDFNDRLSSVDSLEILPIHPRTFSSGLASDLVSGLKENVAEFMRIPRFANSAGIGLASDILV